MQTRVIVLARQIDVEKFGDQANTHLVPGIERVNKERRPRGIVPAIRQVVRAGHVPVTFYLMAELGREVAMGRRRVFGQTEEARLLEEAQQWRSRCIEVLSRAPVGGPFYKAASGMVDAVDGQVEVITGDRGYFHLRAPTTPGPSLPGQDREQR